MRRYWVFRKVKKKQKEEDIIGMAGNGKWWMGGYNFLGTRIRSGRFGQNGILVPTAWG